jgi:hypothetical protein
MQMEFESAVKFPGPHALQMRSCDLKHAVFSVKPGPQFEHGKIFIPSKKELSGIHHVSACEVPQHCTLALEVHADV